MIENTTNMTENTIEDFLINKAHKEYRKIVIFGDVIKITYNDKFSFIIEVSESGQKDITKKSKHITQKIQKIQITYFVGEDTIKQSNQLTLLKDEKFDLRMLDWFAVDKIQQLDLVLSGMDNKSKTELSAKKGNTLMMLMCLCLHRVVYVDGLEDHIEISKGSVIFSALNSTNDDCVKMVFEDNKLKLKYKNHNISKHDYYDCIEKTLVLNMNLDCSKLIVFTEQIKKCGGLSLYVLQECMRQLLLSTEQIKGPTEAEIDEKFAEQKKKLTPKTPEESHEEHFEEQEYPVPKDEESSIPDDKLKSPKPSWSEILFKAVVVFLVVAIIATLCFWKYEQYNNVEKPESVGHVESGVATEEDISHVVMDISGV